ncbi:helix-turn-helix domain-containing protein [Altererythrobacter lutimaris]|uniref:Helix-turn-helix transcriptional regulator n=1 Tax=Altererythrobacter lutimaris TaxID=2743979 RepID=A0A850H5E0_9SPHN|nr:helix-turn-helix transcriptional regulator [Altererythrobacter lutimaris]NVE94377.1 helix-turn-helix transcriptional regulator [Altererythrobacter lutimaris]
MVSPDKSEGEESHEGLSSLLAANVSNSGKTRIEISRQTSIHKDTLRRILTGERAATLAEASCILSACGVDPKFALVFFILTDAD